MKTNYINGLCDFIENSPSAFHCISTAVAELEKNGYSKLSEDEKWSLREGGKYYVVRNGSSLIAFRLNRMGGGYMIAASHSDQPGFRIKPTGSSNAGGYQKLSVERYGGAILYSWLDRPLSIAGKVVISTSEGLAIKNLHLRRPVAVIPSTAIHLNRGVNDGFKPDPRTDMIPLLSTTQGDDVMSVIAAELGCDKKDILSHDLFVYVAERGVTLGTDGGLILAPRLDDLQCAYTTLMGFIEAENCRENPVLCIFDNEEVGSQTKQGAASTMLYDVLRRITPCDEDYNIAIAKSFMVSADNAHAKHPNHPELSDPENAPVINGGIVIKHNANQRYTTDAVSEAFFKSLLASLSLPCQQYCNRADMPGGSTLGSIANTVVSVATVDIGLPQLAMHSAVETAGVKDTIDMVSAMRAFFASSFSESFIKA